MLRIALTFVTIALVAVNPERLYIFLLSLFMVAALSDFLDGYIARKHDIVSDFGKIFDPLADKILAFTFLFILYDTQLIAGWLILLLIVRDLLVDGVRGALVSSVVVPAIVTAKLKTIFVFLLIAAALFVLAFDIKNSSVVVITTLAYGALVLSYVSAFQYAIIFLNAFKNRTSANDRSSSI